MTDNEFNVMKLDAMQTELENLIKKIDGIKDATVMITLPDEGILFKIKQRGIRIDRFNDRARL